MLKGSVLLNRPDCSEIALQTMQQHPQAHMLSGHLQGRFLAMISRLLSPNFILEIGTFTGYSAVCLAEGLRSGRRTSYN